MACCLKHRVGGKYRTTYEASHADDAKLKDIHFRIQFSILRIIQLRNM